jgi:hypothetical protein
MTRLTVAGKVFIRLIIITKYSIAARLASQYSAIQAA